jgi:hypothetical protein
MSWSTEFTPFKLLYGDETVSPEEVKTKSIRVIIVATKDATSEKI